MAFLSVSIYLQSNNEGTKLFSLVVIADIFYANVPTKLQLIITLYINQFPHPALHFHKCFVCRFTIIAQHQEISALR